MHGADRGLPAGQEHVLGVRAAGRAQPDRAPPADPGAGDQHGVGLRRHRGRGLGGPPVVAGQRPGRRRGVRLAQDAVQPLQLRGRHLLAAVDDRRRPRSVARASRLLLVGQRQDPQGQDLVDLGGVEQRAGALRGHRGVVVQDDRRRPARRPRSARRARRHRPGPASSGAGGSGAAAARASSGGSITRDEPRAARPPAAGARRSASDRSAASLSGGRCRRCWSTAQPQPQQAAVRPRRPADTAAAQRPPAARPAGPPRHALDVLAAGDLPPAARAPRRSVASAKVPSSRSTSTASSQLVQTRVAGPQLVDRLEAAVGVARSAVRRCSWRKRRCTVDRRAPSSGRSRHSTARSASSPSPASAAPGGPSTPNCQRTWFLAAVDR